MSSTPLISILIPVYNVERYLAHCLDSIINQTYQNLQIVLVDDGSKDNSLNICQKYAERDKRIEVYHQKNQGVAATRNHLLEKVKGEYVLFVDSDDWIETDMVEKLLKLIIENDADISECQNVINNQPCNKDETGPIIWNQEKAIYEFLRHTNFNGSMCNKLVKSSLLQNKKFHCGISYGEDALFCWYVLQRAKRIVRTSQQYYHYRKNENSLSHQEWTPEKKGSGSIVWNTITEETKRMWPQYLKIAKARYAIEDMWGLYYASLANYPYDKHIRKRQLNIRNNLKLIRKSRLVSYNKILTAYILAYCYPLGKLLKYTRK